MNQMNMLGIFHLHRHEKQHYDRAFASYLASDLSLQTASSYLEIDYDYDLVVEVDGILLLLDVVVQFHLQIHFVPRSMNGFLK